MRRSVLVAAVLMLAVAAKLVTAQTVPVGSGSSFGGGSVPNPIIAPNGSCTNPAYRFAGDADTGLALVGNELVVCVSGSARATFAQGNLSMNGATYFGNGSTTFAALNLTANGQSVYCSDCTQANPTASGGSGAYIVRVNGVNIGLPTGGSGTVASFSVANTQEFSVTNPTTTPELARTAVNAAGSVSGAQTVNWSLGVNYSATLTGATTFTFSNPISNSFYFMQVTNNGAAAHTITWPASVTWVGGSGVPQPSGASKTDSYSFYYDGTTYWGRAVPQDWLTATMSATSTVRLGGATSTDSNAFGSLGGRLFTDPNTYTTAGTSIATIASVNIPAGFFTRAGACAEVWSTWITANNGNSKTVGIAFGGTPSNIVSRTTTSALAIIDARVMICRGANANEQRAWGMDFQAGPTGGGYFLQASETEANASTVHFRATTPTAAGDLTLRAYTIRLWN